LSKAWSASEYELDIYVKELLAVLTAFSAWGHLWRGLQVLVWIDNSVALNSLNKGKTTSESWPVLSRIFEMASKFEFTFRALYIPSAWNVLADKLSRDQWIFSCLKVIMANQFFQACVDFEPQVIISPIMDCEALRAMVKWQTHAVPVLLPISTPLALAA
jgi:hypothetical protein